MKCKKILRGPKSKANDSLLDAEQEANYYLYPCSSLVFSQELWPTFWYCARTTKKYIFPICLGMKEKN